MIPWSFFSEFYIIMYFMMLDYSINFNPGAV